MVRAVQRCGSTDLVAETAAILPLDRRSLARTRRNAAALPRCSPTLPHLCRLNVVLRV